MISKIIQKFLEHANLIFTQMIVLLLLYYRIVLKHSKSEKAEISLKTDI